MKTKTVYFCTNCGGEFPQWLGKCPACGAWNTLTEHVEAPARSASSAIRRDRAERRPKRLSQIASGNEQRFSTGMGELDRVLGGGAVQGSLVLVGGAPGIGKSTLLLQICNALCRNGTVLYVSGEESESQLKMRAERLGVLPENLLFFAETEMDTILTAVKETKPDILIVDSIQTMSGSDHDSSPGSITQVKDCTMALMQLSKTTGITVFVVGHVNKDAYMGMSTKQNENNRGSVGVMFTDNTKAKVYGNDELALFVLEKADGNRYYFKNINGNGYLTVAGNTGLRTGEADYYASASVEIGDQSAGYPATITFRGDKVRTMRYSANSRTFSTYTDAALNQDVFLYGVNATPLRYIEDEMKAGTEDNPVQVTVSDELIGTWAVKNLLWAKDQGYANVKTFAEEGQQDYVKDILKYQRNEGWDQSNWVILDFTAEAGGAEKATEFIGKKIEMASVTGTYVDDVNYTIQLKQAPALAKDDSGNPIDVSGDYPGYMGVMGGANYNPQAATEGGTGDYTYAYNTYVPANFLEDNLNAPFGDGFVAGDAAAASHVGEQLFFVNPKVMEVARIWAVYAGKGADGKDIFTVYEPDQHNVNGWGVEGAFSVEWNYNRLDASNPDELGCPQGIADKVNEAFLFHAVVASNPAIANAPLRAATAPQGTADATPSMSRGYRLYPLDFPNDGSNYTAVSEVRGVKTVESVRYYNIMGMESEKPFEGINIVVTRYSDGTTSTAKVLR